MQKFLHNILKIVERVIENLVGQQVNIDEM